MNKLLEKYKNLSIMVKATFWFFWASLFQNGISVLTTPIFTRLLTTEEYGQYTTFTSWMDFLSVLISLKMYAGVFSAGIVKCEEDRDRYTASVQGLAATLTLIWFCAYAFVEKQANSILALNTTQTMAMLLMIWTTSIFSFWAVEQRVDHKYKQLIIVIIFVSVMKPATGIVAVCIAEDKVTARIVTLAMVQLMAYIGFFFEDIRRGKKFFDKKYWLYMLQLSIPLLPHYISATIMNSSDRIMIRQILGEEAAGIYGLAYSVAMVTLLVNNALIQTMEPWILKKIKSKNMEAVEKRIYIALTLIAIVDILFILLAPEMIQIFAPSTYWEGKWVIPPVAMSQYFQFMYSLFALFQFYYEKKVLIAATSLVGAVLNVILNYIFIPKFGYVAAGYTTLFCIMIYAIAHYALMQRICTKEYGKRIFSIKYTTLHLITFLVMGMVTTLSYYNLILRWGIIIAIIVLIFTFKKKLLALMKSLISVMKS